MPVEDLLCNSTRVTAAAGTSFAGIFKIATHTATTLPSWRVSLTGSSFRPLPKVFHCCPMGSSCYNYCGL